MNVLINHIYLIEVLELLSNGKHLSVEALAAIGSAVGRGSKTSRWTVTGPKLNCIRVIKYVTGYGIKEAQEAYETGWSTQDKTGLDKIITNMNIKDIILTKLS